MRDCLVLGSGRSGTSMVAGALARAGYFMGAELFRPRISNPKGFFEDSEVNGLNEALLAGALGPKSRFGEGQRWLARPDRDHPFAFEGQLAERARALLARRPFCFKDPRLCFTLPAWRALAPDARLVCVFRDPALTAASLLEELRRAPYLAGLEFGVEDAFELWRAQYESVLAQRATGGEWLFLHYDQMLDAEGPERLGAFLGATVDREFADAHLRRAVSALEAPPALRELHGQLCDLAEHRPAPSARTGNSASSATPRVSVAARVGDADRTRVPELLEDVRGQRGIEAELILVDVTAAGDLECADARIVRVPPECRGRGWQAAAELAQGEFLALAVPGCRWLPAHLARALDALEAAPQAELSVTDLYLVDEHGQFVGRSSPAAMGAAPGPFFEAGLVLRRTAAAKFDRRAFVPAERALHARLLEEGRVVSVIEPGLTVERARHDGAFERSREDAALVALQRRPAPERPELSVSICTFRRHAVLVECIEAFARQLVVPGTFELVVVDDGSDDGTAAWLDGLELAVPLRVVHQPNAGLAAARNAGLELARGRSVLFVNDDTLPFPDCVERHLVAHATHPGQALAVLGSFEQPPAELGNALMRHLERSSLVFAYDGLTPGELYAGQYFWTCNVSVDLELVRRVGGFDPSFRHYGCEDTDLGLRLEDLGVRVLYEPRARALHRHRMDFDYLRCRQRQVARAYVRLARKHPDVLRRWGNDRLEGAWLAERLEPLEGSLRELEDAARVLSRIDLAALENLGEPHAALAKEVSERLAELLARLDTVWWWRGYLDGMAEHGLAGFGELAAASGSHPFPADTEAARAPRLLAFPRWDDDASLARLMELAAPAAGFATLVLRFDPERDGEREGALGRLSRAYEERLAPGTTLDVLLEEANLDRTAARRLGRGVEGLLVVGGEDAQALSLVAAERLADPAAVAAWRRRFEAPRDLPPHPDGRYAELPELSIVVPTRDRPAELAQLLERLGAQDLEPARFEVLVVDDGSREPLARQLAGRTYPFELILLHQAPAGPGAARNLALGRARGEIVLFLNDDAVPATDLARRHLEAQRRSSGTLAVLGTFQLLSRHVADSLAWHVETSTALFAQPRMQAGVLYEGSAFCTGNLSVPRAALRAAGGFDEALPFAGGEDTELGLRLMRGQGLRVLYDPRIRCGHDHALDLASLLRRHQVLGWVAHRIQERHTGAALVPGWPLAAPDWAELEAEDREGQVAFDLLRERVDSLLRAERRAGRGPQQRAALSEAFESLQDHAFRRGLLRAHAGLPALEDAPLPVPLAGIALP